MATIQQLQTENLNNITNKVDPQSITPMIDGAERNKVLLELRDRGVIQLANTSDLATQSAANTKIVLIPAVGLFVYADAGTVNDVTVFAAAGTGVWILKISNTEAILLDLAGKEAIANKNQPGGYAGLDSNSKINPDQLPALAVNSIQVVADQAARLALTNVQEGDAVKQADTENTYLLAQLPASVDANWISIGGSVVDWSAITNKPDFIATLLTGYVLSSGTVTAADSILTAFQKVAGNVDANTLAINNSSVGNKLFNYYNFR